jgi:hypothetical protein
VLEHGEKIVEPAFRYSVERPYPTNRLNTTAEFFLLLTRWQRERERPKITERHELLRSATILSVDDVVEIMAT